MDIDAVNAPLTIPPSPSRRRASLGLAAGAAALMTRGVRAQGAWPERPIRLVVNAPPGGVADISARLVAEGLAPSLGKPLVVDNKAGASGLIGVQEMLRAPADGHTFLVSVNGAFTEVPHTVKYPVDPLKDVRPIADIYLGGLVLVGHSSVPAKTLPELIDWVRRDPKGVSYASYSPGTLSHILGLQLAKAAGVTLNHVGYRGSPPAMQDLLGGQVPLMFNAISNVLPHLKEGSIRAYAVALPSRSPFVPEVPTFPELGYTDMQAAVWMGLWSSPQLPAPIATRMHDEMKRLLARPELRQRFADLALSPAAPRSPEELSRSMAVDFERAGALLRAAGFKPEG